MENFLSNKLIGIEFFKKKEKKRNSINKFYIIYFTYKSTKS